MFSLSDCMELFFKVLVNGLCCACGQTVLRPFVPPVKFYRIVLGVDVDVRPAAGNHDFNASGFAVTADPVFHVVIIASQVVVEGKRLQIVLVVGCLACGGRCIRSLPDGTVRRPMRIPLCIQGSGTSRCRNMPRFALLCPCRSLCSRPS